MFFILTGPKNCTLLSKHRIFNEQKDVSTQTDITQEQLKHLVEQISPKDVSEGVIVEKNPEFESAVLDPPDKISTSPPPPPPPLPVLFAKNPEFKPCFMTMTKCNSGSLFLDESLLSEPIENRYVTEEFKSLFGISKKDYSKTLTHKDSGFCDSRDKVESKIEIGRQYAIDLILRQMKISVGDFKTAVLDLNSDIITINSLKILLKLIPNEKEIKILKELEINSLQKSSLTLPENFLFAVSQIEHYAVYMRTIEFIHTYPTLQSEILKQIFCLKSAIIEVENSTFKDFLFIVFVIVNRMNRDRMYNNCGFKICEIMKLQDVKANTNNATVAWDKYSKCNKNLLTYIIRSISKHDPTIVEFCKNWSNFKNVTGITDVNFKNEMEAFKLGIDNLSFLEKIKNFPGYDICKTNLVICQNLYDSLRQKIDDTKSIYLSFLKKLNEIEGVDTEKDVISPELFFFKSLLPLSNLVKESLERDKLM